VNVIASASKKSLFTISHLEIGEQLLYRNVQRFRGGLVFKAHRLLYHSTLGLRVIKKKKNLESGVGVHHLPAKNRINVISRLETGANAKVLIHHLPSEHRVEVQHLPSKKRVDVISHLKQG